MRLFGWFLREPIPTVPTFSQRPPIKSVTRDPFGPSPYKFTPTTQQPTAQREAEDNTMSTLIAGMVIDSMLSNDRHVDPPAPAVVSDFKSGGGEHGGGGASESFDSPDASESPASE